LRPKIWCTSNARIDLPNHGQSLTTDEAKAIAEETYVYGYSLIMTEVTRVL